MTRRPPVIAGAMCALLACTASAPDEPTGQPGSDGQPTGAGRDAGAVQLSIDPVPSPTGWTSIPVSGRGPRDGTILIDTPLAGQLWQNLGGDGQFCVDVSLMPDRSNVIHVRAVDDQGNSSGTVSLEVAHDAALRADAGAPASPDPMLLNVAADQVEIEVHGDLLDNTVASSMVDGDQDTGALISDPPAQVGWVAIELAGPRTIDHLRVFSGTGQSGSDCPLSHFRVFLSDSTLSPGAPGVGASDGEWALIAEVSDGAVDQLVAPSVTQAVARFVALEFLSKDCMPYLLYPGQHRVREIQIWSPADAGDSETPGSPSCSTGGF